MSLRLGLIAPKNTPEQKLWLLSFLRNTIGEPYSRGRHYDLVWFLNITPEIRLIRRHTDARTFVVGMEPKGMYPPNYDPALLDLADRYMGYRNFANRNDAGFFEPYLFPVRPEEFIRREFPVSMASPRDLDFCIFATHDPNIRSEAGRIISRHRAFLGGPLFDHRVDDKLPCQRRCRYEIISENEINDWYFSEKIGEALLAGCVPVYYGCRRIMDFIPASLYVDMHEFADSSGRPDVEAVIAHCLTRGVYEAHAEAIRQSAESLLLGRFSIETCMIEPLQRYLDELQSTAFRSRKASWRWRWWGVKNQLRGWARSIRRWVTP
jgi:hypothetical protein